MKIDCTLDSLLLPALGTYSNEFGTKKLKGGLSTKECCDDTMLPFRKMRPYEVNEDSETTEIQHNAVFVVKTVGVTLTLHDSSEDFLGCEVRVINVSDGAVTVKGGVSGLDGGIDGIEIPAKREEAFIFLSDGWHSMFSVYKNVITQEIADKAVTNSKIADKAVTNSKIADGTVEAKKLAISVFNMNYPIGFTYVQFPQQASPNELWGKFSTWKEISYNGAFFRASGGNAAAFIEKSGVLRKQNQSLQSHSHTINHTHTRGTMDITGQIAGASCFYNHFSSSYANGAFSLVGWGWGKTQGVDWNPDSSLIADFVASRTWTGKTSGPSDNNSGSTGDTETRPSNYSVRIWKRTA